MADASLVARRANPLDGAVAAGSVGGVTLTAASPAARFVLRGGSDAAEAAGAAFGVRPPDAINSAATGPEGRTALKVGPDEWLLLAPGADPVALFETLEGQVGVAHSLVDVSHRQTAILVEGPGAALALNAAVPLDLSIEAFPVGMATRTIFEKAEIVLWREAPETFRVEVWRTFSPYVLALLEAVRQENAVS